MKRVQTPDESSAEHSPKKISKKHKSEKMKTTKEYFREGTFSKVFLLKWVLCLCVGFLFPSSICSVFMPKASDQG